MGSLGEKNGKYRSGQVIAKYESGPKQSPGLKNLFTEQELHTLRTVYPNQIDEESLPWQSNLLTEAMLLWEKTLGQVQFNIRVKIKICLKHQRRPKIKEKHADIAYKISAAGCLLNTEENILTKQLNCGDQLHQVLGLVLTTNTMRANQNPFITKDVLVGTNNLYSMLLCLQLRGRRALLTKSKLKKTRQSARFSLRAMYKSDQLNLLYNLNVIINA